jgi:hypothetical protein
MPVYDGLIRQRPVLITALLTATDPLLGRPSNDEVYDTNYVMDSIIYPVTHCVANCAY